MADQQIKSITGWTYYTIENELNKFISSYKEYDEKGRLIEETDYLARDEIEMKVLFAYDNQGKLVKKTHYYAEESPSEVTYYTYTSEGRLKHEEVVYPDGSKMIKNYLYDPKTRQATITILDENEKLEEKQVKTYDENNNVIADESYDNKNKLKEKTTYEYNENNKPVTETVLSPKGKTRYKKFYRYDEAGNLVQSQTLNKKGRVIDVIKYTYDEQNRRMEVQHGIGNFIEYEYNDAKRTVKVKEYGNGGLENEVVLKYNQDGYLVEERHADTKTSYVYNFYNK